jgi:hypothetical protein
VQMMKPQMQGNQMCVCGGGGVGVGTGRGGSGLLHDGRLGLFVMEDMQQSTTQDGGVI